MTGCIMELKMGLLLFVLPYICSFFFLSRSKISLQPLFTWLSLVMSLDDVVFCLFVLSFFPRDVLDEIVNLIESVSEGFPSYSYLCMRALCGKTFRNEHFAHVIREFFSQGSYITKICFFSLQIRFTKGSDQVNGKNPQLTSRKD